MQVVLVGTAVSLVPGEPQCLEVGVESFTAAGAKGLEGSSMVATGVMGGAYSELFSR